MAFALTDLRTDLDNLLATAVDSSTWTTTIKDQAVREATRQYDDFLVYESSFTVTTTGYEQDLATLPDLHQILALAWPWSTGDSFDHAFVRWRYVTDQRVYIENGQPATGNTIRVRYRKLHKINGLDAALATTVFDRHRMLVALWAAAWACELRMRQLTENPAIPTQAYTQLASLALSFRKEADQRARNVQTLPGPGPTWSSIGL